MPHPVSRRRMLQQGASALAAPALVACGGSFEFSSDLTPSRLDTALGRLDGWAQDLMARTQLPGMAITVVRGDRIVYARGFGLRKVGSADRVTPDTVFQLASVSKSIGATVVARQVGQGVVRWDTSLRSLLPWFALKDEATTAQLTVADLYAHRSGLPDHAGDYLEDLGFSRRPTLERLRYLPLEPFRKHYAYTNFGLTAAAEGVAVVSGADWASLSEQALYQPLGMGSTSSRYADFLARANRATGHVRVNGVWQTGLVRDPDTQSPAGGVSSSVNDMARWLGMLLGDGFYGGRQVVASSALAPAWQRQIESSPGQFYGLGFNVGTTGGGRPVVSHSGAFSLGTATAFTVLPTAGVAIVALTNGFPLGVPETLCQQFVDTLENGSLQKDWWSLYSAAFAGMLQPSGSLVGMARPTNPRPSAALASYAGNWLNDYYGPLQTRVVAGALQITLGPASKSFSLQHWDGDVFTFEPAGESANPGSISKATFSGGRLTLEFYDDEGLGTFVRA